MEKAANRELARILKSEALEEVTWPTDTACKAFFVQKPGSPDSDPSVRMVNNMKPVNQKDRVPRVSHGWQKQDSQQLEPGDVCYRVIDLVEGFHQIPVDEASHDLLTVILPQGKYRFKVWCAPQIILISPPFAMRRGTIRMLMIF